VEKICGIKSAGVGVAIGQHSPYSPHPSSSFREPCHAGCREPYFLVRQEGLSIEGRVGFLEGYSEGGR
jgi:hypothetical protein